MDCRRAEESLHLWIDDELDTSARTELTAHLAECPDCARKLAEYRHLDTLLAQISAQTKVPAGLYGRIMEAIDRESAPHKSGVHRWARWAASAAAVLLLGVAVGVLWRAGVWPGPMGKSAAPRYEMAREEAAPMEAPAADMEAEGAAMEQEADENRVNAMEEPAGEPAEGVGEPEEGTGELYGVRGDMVMEATWTVAALGGDHRSQGGADAIAAFSAGHGLTVVETGEDWISVQWETDADREALLAFLEENGELALTDREAEGRMLRIYIR